MRGKISCHTYSDTGRTINQKIRKFRRKHNWFSSCLVVVGNEINRIVPYVFEHVRSRGGHACFGISHRSRRVAVDTSEVALRVNQGVAHIPCLAHSYQRRIYNSFAVRMVVTAGITGNLCTLSVLAAGTKVQVVHSHQDAPL